MQKQHLHQEASLITLPPPTTPTILSTTLYFLHERSTKQREENAPTDYFCARAAANVSLLPRPGRRANESRGRGRSRDAAAADDLWAAGKSASSPHSLWRANSQRMWLLVCWRCHTPTTTNGRGEEETEEAASTLTKIHSTTGNYLGEHQWGF